MAFPVTSAGVETLAARDLRAVASLRTTLQPISGAGSAAGTPSPIQTISAPAAVENTGQDTSGAPFGGARPQASAVPSPLQNAAPTAAQTISTAAADTGTQTRGIVARAATTLTVATPQAAPTASQPLEAAGASAQSDNLGDLTEEQEAEVRELEARDREVRQHEAAHARVGGEFAGSPQFTFTTGPDGQRYAVAGSVSISTSPVRGDPEATLEKARIVRAAALAPGEPSGQDRRVAQQAAALEAQARAELAQLRAAEAREAFTGGEEGAEDGTAETAPALEGGPDLEGGPTFEGGEGAPSPDLPPAPTPVPPEFEPAPLPEIFVGGGNGPGRDALAQGAFGQGAVSFGLSQSAPGIAGRQAGIERGLPPGIAARLENGGTLPPGLERFAEVSGIETGEDDAPELEIISAGNEDDDEDTTTGLSEDDGTRPALEGGPTFEDPEATINAAIAGALSAFSGPSQVSTGGIGGAGFAGGGAAQGLLDLFA